MFILSVQLTTCRIGNLTRLIHTLAVETDIEVNPENNGIDYFTSPRLPGVHEISDKPATVRDGIERRTKQAK